jgi:FMN-dependent oxidoreductase (nitrilotriacetate monooxygenase family)
MQGSQDQSNRKMRLGAFIRAHGHHVAAWRHPDVAQEADINFPHMVEIARLAERGLFDMLFSADVVGVAQDDPDDLCLSSFVSRLEPLTLFSALAALTTHIGLVCTSTTTYDEPYFIARRFATLDLISGGRSGWNLVTSMQPFEAQNFGRETHLTLGDRYKRAEEFADVVRGLWDSWEDDAFIRDKDSGRFFDPVKLHVLDHKGEFFRVRGPLNVARSPQGHPVMVQAGSSDAGRELAARTAEVIFTAHQTVEDARAFYADVKDRAARHGRKPEHVLIMPGIYAMVGRTEQEAREKYDKLQSLIHPRVGVKFLSQFLNCDITQYPVDEPLPDQIEQQLVGSRPALLVKMARRDNLTIRQLYMRMAGARGHRQIFGTASQIADELEFWFTGGAADGFNVMPPILPDSLEDFVELVIPELQRRGLFRLHYEGRTLRENLGLPYPGNRFSQTQTAPPYARRA